jgi:hypothetical protein
MNLLTGRTISIELSDDQAKQISQVLEQVAQFQALGEEDAQKSVDAIQGALTDEQTKVLDSIGLPARRGGGGPGGGGGSATSRPPEPYPNPFGQEGDAKSALGELRERLQQKAQ